MTLEILAQQDTTRNQLEAIPPEIREAYSISDSAAVQPITHGLVNQTFSVTEGPDRTVLQRLSGVIHPESPRDAAIVSEHLAEKDWESPLLRPTTDGRLSAQDAAGLTWRRQQHIASDGRVPDCVGGRVLIDAVDMLGRWHRDVADLDYKPLYGIPHFHDTDYYAERLDEVRHNLPDSRTRTLAGHALRGYERMTTDAIDAPQVIHGDPKLDNILFRDGKPFTLIDFDTLMLGSPWLDVGDMLRSLIGKQLSGRQTPDAGQLEQLSLTYNRSAELREPTAQSHRKAMLATAQIATELAMRYLLDINDEDYFSWDSATFESRRDNHVPRAELQLTIAKLSLTFANNIK